MEAIVVDKIMKLESSIERSFVNYVTKLGYKTIKVKKFGWPDRTVILHNGYHFYIEFKRPGEELRPMQVHVNDILSRTGAHVYTCDSFKKAVNTFKYELEMSGESYKPFSKLEVH